jgi:hypothetical protein
MNINDATEAGMVIPDEFLYGDYNGGLVNKANYTYFVEVFGDLDGVVEIYGDYDLHGIAIEPDLLASNEEIKEMFARLEDYPLVCEDTYDTVCAESEEEAWESWVRSEFRSQLYHYHDDDEIIDDLTNEDLDRIFRHVSNRECIYFQQEGTGMTIDVDAVAKATSIDLIQGYKALYTAKAVYSAFGTISSENIVGMMSSEDITTVAISLLATVRQGKAKWADAIAVINDHREEQGMEHVNMFLHWDMFAY